MRIAHIISTFPPYKGGMGNSVYYSAREMAKLGHTNIIFTPAYDPTLPKHEVLEKNLEVFRLNSFLTIGNGAVIPQLIWKLRGFEIVHLHYPFYGGAEFVLFGLLFTKAKFMVHYHMDTISNGVKGLIFKIYAFFLLPIIIRAARLVTCASIDYVKHSEIKDYYLGHQQKFVHIPFGVDTVDFIPGEKFSAPTILFVGGLDRQHNFKGVEQLIDAFGIVGKKYPHARLTIIGKGDLEDYYRGRIAAHMMGEQATILNSVTDRKLAELYRGSFVTVLPSTNRGEAFGLVLLESLASGTAVIASNLAGVRNVFNNNEHGYLVRPGDVDDLAEKLEKILANENKTLALGKAGRAWIEKEYSWKKFSQRLEAAYCRVLYTPTDINSGPLLASDDE
jgi:glycosyltransferase involved in cell wall biosynthesis